MDLFAVVEEIRTTLKTITGLRVPPWGVDKASPPAALVALPERIRYHTVYGRGVDVYEGMGVVVLVGRPGERTAQRRLAAYADGAGPKSIVAALEGHQWATCDDVTVGDAVPDFPTFGDVLYLGMTFPLTIIGTGQ